MERLGMEEGVPIEAKMVTRAIENAQRRVEGQNFDIRKHLLEYDDVMNKQREVVYHRRREFLSGGDLREDVLEMARVAARELASKCAVADSPVSEWDWKSLDDAMFSQFRLHFELGDEEKESLTVDSLCALAEQRVVAAYEKREEEMTPEVVRHLERVITLQSMDNHWKDHLLAMDHLKEGIGLRGYGQRNPLQEYQREGFDMFEQMLISFETDVVEKLYSVRIAAEEDVDRMERRREAEQKDI
ncbi:MAG: preprotein translocase subunit SecA, partial [Candidatus Binatia bacterium]